MWTLGKEVARSKIRVGPGVALSDPNQTRWDLRRIPSKPGRSRGVEGSTDYLPIAEITPLASLVSRMTLFKHSHMGNDACLAMLNDNRSSPGSHALIASCKTGLAHRYTMHCPVVQLSMCKSTSVQAVYVCTTMSRWESMYGYLWGKRREVYPLHDCGTASLDCGHLAGLDPIVPVRSIPPRLRVLY